MPPANTKGSIRLLCYEPNQKVPLHHPHADEIFYVLKSQGEISVGAEKMKVKNGFFVKAPAGVLHQWKNGKERLVLTSVLISPANYAHAKKNT